MRPYWLLLLTFSLTLPAAVVTAVEPEPSDENRPAYSNFARQVIVEDPDGSLRIAITENKWQLPPEKYRLSGPWALETPILSPPPRPRPVVPTPRRFANLISNEALPVVCNLEQFREFNEVLISNNDPPRDASMSLTSTMEMMEDADLAREVNIASNEWIHALGNVFDKNEAPMGLMNKLFELQRFDALEFVIDDSGIQANDPNIMRSQGLLMNHWQEMRYYVKEIVEIVAHVPTNIIRIRFVNHCDRLSFNRGTNSPQQFIQNMLAMIDGTFDDILRYGPNGHASFEEAVGNSLQQGGNVARYFFSETQQSVNSISAIKSLIQRRFSPANNPVTFVSQTNYQWMFDISEGTTFCAALNKYENHAMEVFKHQGRAFPYTPGFYLISILTAAMNEIDLNSLDQTVPFAKTTLENIFGFMMSPEEYRYYFNKFEQQQHDRFAIAQSANMSPVERFECNFNWGPYYSDFVRIISRQQLRVFHDYIFRMNQILGR